MSSSIEKALNKLKNKQSKSKSSKVHGDSQSASAGAIEKHIKNGDGLEKEKNIEGVKTKREVTLDMVRLEAAGILLPAAASSQLSDEFRNIKRPLLKNAFSQDVPHVENSNLIMVTSALPGEGKTYTSINLAMSIAMELDKTVLLIDADVEKASISENLGFDSGKGLSDLLIDNSLSLNDVLIKTNIPKLTILPAGHHCKNMNELLASANMTNLINELAHYYNDRVIIFDTPPLMITNESKTLSSNVGQIIVVVEAEKTPQTVVKEAISHLDSSKVIGLVLNKSTSTLGLGYGYGYGYGGSRS